jgi:hypothetical protein
MKYIIVHDYSMEDLENSVNVYLQQGWKLQGGVCVVNKGIASIIYFQAMTFEKDSK